MARPIPKQQSQGVLCDQGKKSAIGMSIHHVNPWELESDSVTNIRKALILAEQMGINTMLDECSLPSTLADLPSCKMTGIQKEITAKRKSFFETKKKLAACQQEKKISDLMHIDVIGERINMMKQLSADLNSVLKNRDRLIKRLQTPFVGDFLKIEASYHSYACDTFHHLVSTLNEVSHHLDNLIWVANQDMASSNIEPLVGEVQSLTASLQTSYQTLQQMRRGMEQLQCNSPQRKAHIISPSALPPER